MLIHATVESDNLLLAISKIRTKIKISSDTISASVYPFVALELGKLILTKEKVVFKTNTPTKTTRFSLKERILLI